MSNRGEDEGFRPHPGDPWHPEWHSDVDDTAAERALPQVEKPRRSGWRRRRRGEAAAGVTPVLDETLEPAFEAVEAAVPEELESASARASEAPLPVAEEVVEEALDEEAAVDEWLAFVDEAAVPGEPSTAASPAEPTEELASWLLPMPEAVEAEPPSAGAATLETGEAAAGGGRRWLFRRRRREQVAPADEFPGVALAGEEPLPPPWAPGEAEPSTAPAVEPWEEGAEPGQMAAEVEEEVPAIAEEAREEPTAEIARDEAWPVGSWDQAAVPEEPPGRAWGEGEAGWEEPGPEVAAAEPGALAPTEEAPAASPAAPWGTEAFPPLFPPEDHEEPAEEEAGAVPEWVGDAAAQPAEWPEQAPPVEEEGGEAWDHPAAPAGTAWAPLPEPEPPALPPVQRAAGWAVEPEPPYPEEPYPVPGAVPEEQAWGPATASPGAGAVDMPYPGAPFPTGMGGAPSPEIPDADRQEPITEEMFAVSTTTEHRGLAEEVAAADTAQTELQALSAPMPGLESGLVGFEDVVHLSTEEEFVEPAPSGLPLRVVTGLALVGLLLGALWAGGGFLAGLVGLLMFLGLAEYYGTLRRRGYQPVALFGMLGGIGVLVGTWFYGLVAVPTAVMGTTILVFLYYAFAPRRRAPLANGGLTVLGVLWVTGTAAFVYPIAAAPDFRVLVFAVAASTVAMDVGAYFAGRAWGSSPLAPVLSPNKSVEGLAGGVVLAIVVAVAVGHFMEPLDIRAGAALGLMVAVMAPLGDLAESMIKRSLVVKDMGSILPGHGGVLDRVDAFLFVLPGAWVLYETLGLLG